MKTLEDRNKLYFGLGTVGRDMFYSFEANALLYFLSDVLSLPLWVFLAASSVLSVLRIFDALNDPITGLVIDNIRSPWGKFKPAIVAGGLSSIVFFLLLYANIGTGWVFVAVFGLAYLLWDISYGVNDIAYWTLLPALTQDQAQREKNGTFARICANVGMYIVMVGWQPITTALGNTPKAWFGIACVICLFYAGFMCFTIFGVKEPRMTQADEERTTIRQMLRALGKNDQLLWTTLAMALFMVGYSTTVGFAIYYMKYIFGNEGMYTVMVAVCGVTQLTTLGFYPALARKLNRRQLYTLATALVIAGYLIFFFAEISIVLVVIATMLVFVGQALIQTLMLMFLADTVEYGQWKLGKRNESITFSIQPVVNKIGGALSTGLVAITLVLSGIKVDETTADVIAEGGKLMVKCAMLVVPLIFIVAGYIIYLKKYKISEEFYANMLRDLKEREEV